MPVRTGVGNLGKVHRTSAGRGSFPPTILVPGDHGMPVVTAEERNKNVACGQAQAAPGVPLVPVKGGAFQTGQNWPRWGILEAVDQVSGFGGRGPMSWWEAWV